MNYAKYNIDNYNISISSKKNKIVIMVINIINSTKYNIILDKCDDTSCYSNNENNIGLDLKTDIYDFLINCLEKKPYYNIIINNKEYEDDKDQLHLTFGFKYEMFDFEYTIELSQD